MPLDMNEFEQRYQNQITETEAKTIKQQTDAYQHKKEAARQAASTKKKLAIGCVLLIVSLVIWVVVTQVVIPTVTYKKAEQLLSAMKYDEALPLYTKVSTYKDSPAKIAVCETAICENKYHTAATLQNERKYVEACTIFEELGEYRDSKAKAREAYLLHYGSALENAAVGSHIIFGSYKGKAIEWIVLKKQKDRLLVFSCSIIERLQYNDSSRTYWSSCSLRQWLNSTFFDVAFRPTEQELILTVPVYPDQQYNSDPVYDNIFILSKKEADLVPIDNRTCGERWWLRSLSKSNILAAYVDENGHIEWYESPDKSYGIRPALWINLEFQE